MSFNISGHITVAPIVLVRVISAFSSLILSYTALRVLNPADFGTFTFSISFVTFLSVFLRFGLDRYLLKIILNKKYFDHSKLVLLKILTTWFLVQLFVLPIAFLALYQFSYFALVAAYKSELLAMASSFSMVLVLADFFRAKISVALGLFVSGIILPATTLLYILLVLNPILGDVFNVYIAMACLTVALGIPIGLIITPGKVLGRVKVSIAWSELCNLFLHAVGSVGMVHIPILALGLLGTPEDIAWFQKCFLLSMVIGALTLVMTSIYEPKFARVAGGMGNIDSKEVFESSLNLSLVMITFGIIAAFVIFYNDIYIEFYSEDIWVCFCLGLGHCINLLASRYQCYFMMTKNSVIRNVSLSTLLVLLLGILVFFPRYGVLGVAMAYLVSVLFKLSFYSNTYRDITV